MTGLDVSGRIIVLHQLQAELDAGGVPVPNGLTINGPHLSEPTAAMPPYPCGAGALLFTYDATGQPMDMPAGAQAIVDAHQPALGASYG